MDAEHARFNMIEQQIRPWDVLDQTVLDTLGLLPRERFVPAKWQKLAFADVEIPIGHGEAMMHPRVEGRMLQELAVRTTDHCLEIGTGSGFITACLAHLGKDVDTVELYPEFRQQAAERLKELDFNNVRYFTDDAAHGWQGNPDKSYDVIAVTASLPEYLPTFEQRLSVGGRLFIVSGQNPAHALLITREEDNTFTRKALFETELKPLVGSELSKGFEF